MQRRFTCFTLWALAALICAQATSAQDDWEHTPEAQEFQKSVEKKKQELIQKNGSGTDAGLRSRLLEMRKADQEIRNRIFSGPTGRQVELIPELQKTDAALTEQLKAIVKEKGWPTIALVGLDASQAAALILIHSPDKTFQQQLLPELEKLVADEKIAGNDIATLIDTMALSQGKPQRFGTRFSWKADGPMVMDPVEDPDHLEERRRLYLLPPMSLYKKQLATYYHRQVL